MTASPPIENVRVFYRTGQWCPGQRIGDVVAYDARLLPAYQMAGRPTIDRSYLLLDQGIQLTRPVAFVEPVEGGWYVDVVEVDESQDGFVVHDLYVDFLVPPGAHRYHVLDLDELAGALSDGQITAAQCATALSRTQDFITDICVARRRALLIRRSSFRRLPSLCSSCFHASMNSCQELTGNWS